MPARSRGLAPRLRHLPAIRAPGKRHWATIARVSVLADSKGFTLYWFAPDMAAPPARTPRVMGEVQP